MFQGQMMKNFRAALGLSQRQLATLLDTRQEQINRWENDERTPRGMVTEELGQIYRDFQETIAAVRAGVPVDESLPWVGAARFWAGRDELEVPEYVPVYPSLDTGVEIVDLTEDEGRWSWTVIRPGGYESDYRTDRNGQGLWVWSAGVWSQLRGHAQWEIDPDDPEVSIRAIM